MLMCARRETHKQAKVGVLEDRLSDLSDELLTHMLSFLSTKEAVRTSILSTRWKSVWAFAPTLDLSEKDFFIETGCCIRNRISMRVRFLDFLDRKLSAPFLEKVVIRCDVIHPSYIEPRICALIERKVRELDIVFGFNFQPTHALPESLFSCNTLVVLRVSENLVLNFPVATTCFPSLKVLTLKSILYKDENSAANLFCSCPVLEDLVIVRNLYDNMKTLSVVSQSLKRLWVEFKSPDIQNRCGKKMVIDAPALDYINVDDNVTKYYEVRDLSSLHKAHLHVTNSHSRVCKLLSGISNARFLSLSCSTMLSLAAVDSYNWPIFHNLTCLKFVADKDIDWKWKLVLEFLKNCPILEVLKFEGFSFSYEQTGASWWEWDVPNCLRSHLKTIEITRFIPKNGAEVLRYFVANAEVLEEKIINSRVVVMNN